MNNRPGTALKHIANKCRSRIPADWRLARSENGDTSGSDWIPASVPGAVQLDWARAHGLPPYQEGNNIRQWQGLESYHWIYRTTLPGNLPALTDNQRLFLVLEGIDYACEVRIDGQPVHRQEGLQTPVHLDLTSYARSRQTNPAEIDIHIFPAPMARPVPVDRSQADRSCKPAVAYGWDFHPRLIPLGLWRDAYFEIRPNLHFFKNPEIHYTLNDSCNHVHGRLVAKIFLPPSPPPPPGHAIRWHLRNPDGVILFSAQTPVPAQGNVCEIPFAFDLPPQMLWWPHDQGQPVLHTSEVELFAPAVAGNAHDAPILDSDSSRIGFRKTRLIMAPGEWNQPTQFPKSRSRPPITIEINGRPIFAKGSNWVCPDIFPGQITRERIDTLLGHARDANFNILRAWGGATAPHDWFYERCDELGIMVWQEFPLACNAYPDDDAYLAVLDQESRNLITRLRNHPSLILWCGGNELFNSWSRMTDQSLPLRLLNRNCYELDPSRPFLPTAPLEGMGHGHYLFRDPGNGEEAWAAFQRSACTAYSEFGCPAPAPLAVLNKILPEPERWPPRPGTAWETHHAFGAWIQQSWLCMDAVKHYWGACDTLEKLVERGQLLQSAGLQGLFEEARRQKPVASMALNWCFCEPWPCAANTSLIAWPCEPKPALAAVTASCRTTLASARIRKFAWEPGERFDPELWLLHDGPCPHPSVTMRARLVLNGITHTLITWETGPILPNQNVIGPRVQFILPEFEAGLFTFNLDVETKPSWGTSYRLIRCPSDGKADIALRRELTNF